MKVCISKHILFDKTEVKVYQERNRYIVTVGGKDIAFFLKGDDANSFAVGFAAGYSDAKRE